MNLQIGIALLAFTLSASAREELESLTHEHYLTAGVETSKVFRCLGSEQPDARISFETRVISPTHREARITALSARGVVADAAFLAAVNGDIAGANITGAMLGCSTHGIELTLHLFGKVQDPETGVSQLGETHLKAYLHTGSETFTREYR